MAHARGMLVRHPLRADRIQGGAAKRRPNSSEADPHSRPADRVRTEEITLDIVSPIQGGRRTDPVGYDAAQKIKGRKRHAVVDTLGLMLGCAILPGNVQDRDGGLGVLKEVRRLFPFLERVIADGPIRATKQPVRCAGPRGPDWRS